MGLMQSLDKRTELLLHTLVEQYIADGEPVGSRTLSRSVARHAGVDLSPATIRNVMSDLEELGLIASPHTSAGRIPTSRGYRVFVDAMLTARPLHSLRDIESLSIESLSKGNAPLPTLTGNEPQRVLTNAAQLLSSLSEFVGVISAPKRSTLFRHVEFMPLSDQRVLVIIVAPDNTVQNRILQVAKPFAPSELIEASNYLNANFSGLSFDEVRERLRNELTHLRSEIAALMSAAVEASSDAAEQGEQVVISGQTRLLGVSDFAQDMSSLRRLFEMFEQKTQLLKLLEASGQAEGVRIFIGGDSDVVPVEALSVITAPYEVDGKLVGTLGVIGPTRMAYERMIEIVDITAKLVGNALSQPR
jgi:heat-inducible transcriptional repressor